MALACLGVAACGGDDDGGSDTNTVGGSGAPAETEQGPTVNAARVERSVKKELDGFELSGLNVPVYPPGGGAPDQTQIGGGRLDVKSVSCPPDVPLERGGTFSCELEGGDNDGSVRLTILNQAGSSMRFVATIAGEGSGEGLPTETEVKGKLRVR